jgi:hypothetical protein
MITETVKQKLRSVRIGVGAASYSEVCPPNENRKFLSIVGFIENIQNGDPANMPSLAIFFDRVLNTTEDGGILLYPLHCTAITAAGATTAYLWSGCEKLLLNDGAIPKGRIYVRNYYGLATIYVHVIEY